MNCFRYLIVLFVLLINSFLSLKNCGYYGEKGDEIEKKLDACFDKNVRDSRVRMSVGFEICFGYNYSKLNATVAEPLEHRQKLINKKLIDISLKSCFYDKRDPHKPRLPNGDVDFRKEQENINKCKHFFNLIIQAMYNDQEAVESFLDSNIFLIKPMLVEKKRVAHLRKRISKLVDPVDECKEPQIVLRNRLIKKYLEMYLNKVVSPKLPSFNWENLDVLLHPEEYMMRSDKLRKPSESAESVEEEGIEKPKILVPEKRRIVIRDKRPSGEKKEGFLSGLFDFSSSSDEDHHAEVDNFAPDQKPTHEDKEKTKLLMDKDHTHKKDQVLIDKFWDANVRIKNKRIANQDYLRYKVKGFDIDRQIKELFKI